MNGDRKKTCQRLLLTAREKLVWEEVAPVPLNAGEVEVRTIRSAVSVGSEYAWFIGSERSKDFRPGSQLTFPRRMGYESLGVVAASKSPRAQVGDRVVATYGHRTNAVLAPADLLIRVPSDIPDELAILSILSCEAARGADRVNCQPNDPILITGSGVIGLLALHRLKWMGFQNVTVVEPREERRKIAASLGAIRTLSDKDAPASGTFAFGLECSSASGAFRLLQQAMRRGGSICVLADGNYGPLELDPLFHSNELTISGSSDGTDYEEYASLFFAYWRKLKQPVENLFDKYIPSSTLIREFTAMKASSRPLKIMVSYGSDEQDRHARK